MTKRRAENILPPEVLHKRCFRSLSDKDKPVGGVNVIQNANPSTLLLSVAGQRCRKRPSYLEDSLDTDNLPRKVALNKVNSVLGDRKACKSRTFEDDDDDDAGRPVTRRSSRALQTESKKLTDEGNNITAGDKVMHTDEDLSPFNSFQFWRVPLPELDLSLLETEPSAGSYIATSTKDLEAMEICYCGKLIMWVLTLACPGPDSTDEEEWSVLRHTSVSSTDAFGSLDFQACQGGLYLPLEPCEGHFIKDACTYITSSERVTSFLTKEIFYITPVILKEESHIHLGCFEDHSF